MYIKGHFSPGQKVVQIEQDAERTSYLTLFFNSDDSEQWFVISPDSSKKKKEKMFLFPDDEAGLLQAEEEKRKGILFTCSLALIGIALGPSFFSGLMSWHFS